MVILYREEWLATLYMTANQTIIKFAHAYDKTLSFDLTIFGITAYSTPM